MGLKYQDNECSTLEIPVQDRDDDTKSCYPSLGPGSPAYSTLNFQLIESLKFQQNYISLELHLQRLKKSAALFNFTYNEISVRQSLTDYQNHLNATDIFKIRCVLGVDGQCMLSHQIINNTAQYTLRVKLLRDPIDSSNLLWQHKTTAHETRGHYDSLTKLYQSECDALIFMNDKGSITESQHYNIIIEHQGQKITSPHEEGLLPGIYRQKLINTGITVKPITESMLKEASSIWLCNDVRGMIPAELIGEINAPAY